MLNIPVLFLIFNRPDLTERVLASIRQAKPTKLFVAADGPRIHKEGEAELCKQTRDVVLKNIDWECEVHTLLRDTNLGCKIAVSGAITWFFENVESGIILEDDILPDQSFFPFCEEMLIKYKDDERVTQISGVNLMGQSNRKESYFFSKIGGIWGWATWSRCWKHYDVDIKAWDDRKTIKSVRQFLGKRIWFDKMNVNFRTVFEKKYDTWDFQWVFTQLKLKGMSIIPSKNLIENIGFREDATHTKNSNELIESKMKALSIKYPLVYPQDIISDDDYTSYYFGLLNKPEAYFTTILKKIKSNIKNGFKRNS
jgi:hypothetical protein